MGPSSPNIHFGWVGVLCFFCNGTQLYMGTIESLNQVAKLFFTFEVHTFVTFNCTYTLIYVKVTTLQMSNNYFCQPDSNFQWYPCEAEFHCRQKSKHTHPTNVNIE